MHFIEKRSWGMHSKSSKLIIHKSFGRLPIPRRSLWHARTKPSVRGAVAIFLDQALAILGVDATSQSTCEGTVPDGILPIYPIIVIVSKDLQGNFFTFLLHSWKFRVKPARARPVSLDWTDHLPLFWGTIWCSSPWDTNLMVILYRVSSKICGE